MAVIRLGDGMATVLRPLFQGAAVPHQSIRWDPDGSWPAHVATTITTQDGDVVRTLLSLEGDVLATSTAAASERVPAADLSNDPGDSFSAVITRDEIASSRWADGDLDTIPAGLIIERVLRRSRIVKPLRLDMSFGEPFLAGMAIRFHRTLVEDVERWTVIGVGRRDCWSSVTLRAAQERWMGRETPVLVEQGA